MEEIIAGLPVSKKKLLTWSGIAGVILVTAVAGVLIYKQITTPVGVAPVRAAAGPLPKENLATVTSALEIYKSHKGVYPKSLTLLIPEFLDGNLQDLTTPGAYNYLPDAGMKNYKLCLKQESGSDLCTSSVK